MATKQSKAQAQAEDEALQEEAPFEIVDAIEVDDVGDLAEVKGDQAIEAVKDVTFVVVKASIDTQRQFETDTEWACKRLKLEVKVGDAGTDGEGKYAGKRFFPSLVVAYPMHTVEGKRVPDLSVLERIHDAAVAEGKKKDKQGKDKLFPRDYWLKQAQLDFKEFALATGLAAIVEAEDGSGKKGWKMLGPLNDDMLAILASGDVEFIANVTKSFDAFRNDDRNELRRYRAVAAQTEAE